jgi:hypothetical protein
VAEDSFLPRWLTKRGHRLVLSNGIIILAVISLSLLLVVGATVEGRIHTIQVRPMDHGSVLSCQVADATGELTVLFYGRRHIAGVEPGRRIRLRGAVGLRDDGGSR